MKSVTEYLASIRQEQKLSQKAIADAFSKYGISISSKSISAWETGKAMPSAEQFLILCDLLQVSDIRDTFERDEIPTIFSGLNKEGKDKLWEYAKLLRASGLYQPASSNIVPFRRTLRCYQIPVSAGTGQFLDEADYDELEVGNEVPANADFGVHVKGDSMEPQFIDGQTVWIASGQELSDGEIGIFLYDGNAYIKKLAHEGSTTLLVSLNKKYPPIPIQPGIPFQVFGKVVG